MKSRESCIKGAWTCKEKKWETYLRNVMDLNDLTEADRENTMLWKLKTDNKPLEEKIEKKKNCYFGSP